MPARPAGTTRHERRGAGRTTGLGQSRQQGPGERGWAGRRQRRAAPPGPCAGPSRGRGRVGARVRPGCGTRSGRPPRGPCRSVGPSDRLRGDGGSGIRTAPGPPHGQGESGSGGGPRRSGARRGGGRPRRSWRPRRGSCRDARGWPDAGAARSEGRQHEFAAEDVAHAAKAGLGEPADPLLGLRRAAERRRRRASATSRPARRGRPRHLVAFPARPSGARHSPAWRANAGCLVARGPRQGRRIAGRRAGELDGGGIQAEVLGGSEPLALRARCFCDDVRQDLFRRLARGLLGERAEPGQVPSGAVRPQAVAGGRLLAEAGRDKRRLAQRVDVRVARPLFARGPGQADPLRRVASRPSPPSACRARGQAVGPWKEPGRLRSGPSART